MDQTPNPYCEGQTVMPVTVQESVCNQPETQPMPPTQNTDVTSDTSMYTESAMSQPLSQLPGNNVKDSRINFDSIRIAYKMFEVKLMED